MIELRVVFLHMYIVRRAGASSLACCHKLNVVCSVFKGMPIINLINELVGQCGRGVLAVVGGVAGA